MKRFAFILTVIALGALGTVACGGGNTDTASTASKAPAPRKLRIALIPKSLDIPVFDYANKGAQRAAKELGNVEVIYRGPDKADELKQKEIMESFISQKVDGIAISVLNADAMKETIDKAVDAGIPVMTWDSDAPTSKRVAFYGVDDYKSGLIMGEETGKLLNGKGTVAFLTSLGANNLQERLRGAKDALAKFPGIKVVDTFDIKEDSMRCQELIETGTNRYPNLGAWVSVGGWPVFSANALKPVDPAKTKFVSFDTVASGIDLLKAGKVQVLLGQKYFGWGSEPVKMIVDMILNGKKPATAVIDSGVDVVTMANVDEYVAQFKKMEGGGL
jgi:ribose transport system substrate-binding protein